MTRNLDEVHIRNWTNLGTTAPVPRWSVDLIVRWTRDDGTKGEHSRTVVFPNILANVPLRRLREYMEQIILTELRIQQGIDVDPDA